MIPQNLSPISASQYKTRQLDKGDHGANVNGLGIGQIGKTPDNVPIGDPTFPLEAVPQNCIIDEASCNNKT